MRPTSAASLHNTAARLRLAVSSTCNETTTTATRFPSRSKVLYWQFAGLHRTPQRTSPANALANQHTAPTPGTLYGHTEQAARSQQLNTGLFIGSTRFHPSGFTSSWTLSSKFFATFPHGTCLLSVSWSYLALDEVYHLLWAAFPSNPTPTERNPRRPSTEQAFHLLWNPSQGEFKSTATKENRLYTLHLPSPVRATGFSAGLFPVHSPLLRESSLVSFPPLTDMLKFSG